MERVLIVGNGYAGLQAAQTLSREKGLSVTMVTPEPGPAYCPHLLPELAAGRKESADLYLSDPRDFAALGVSFKPGAGVLRLSARDRTALLSTGETFSFDKAVIATGAKPFIPENLKGLVTECRNVLTLKRLDDALALKSLLARGAKRLVIVGAGRVGILLAESLKDTGVEVFLIEIGPAILATMLQPDVSARLSPALLERRHLRIHAGVRIAAIATEGGAAREVNLSDGTVLPCDVAVITTGVEPNVGFLANGLEVPQGEGLPVDPRMETREAGIFAAGDVVCFETITGKKDVGQLVVNARAQGEVAARNIAGQKSLCPPSFTGNIVKLPPLMAARIGDIDGDDQADFAVAKSFARATLSGGTVIGLQLVGDPEDLRGLVPAVLKRFRNSDLGDLLRGRLDLGLFPLLASRSLPWA